MDAVVVQPAAGDGEGGADVELTIHPLPAYNTTGYLGIVRNPKNHFVISCHGCEASPRTCQGRVQTDTQAKALGCLYAVNAGPFDMTTGACRGHVVSHQDVVMNPQAQPAGVDFGLDAAGNFVMGTLNHSFVQHRDFVGLVTGFGWLVQHGDIVPSTGGEIAPRTAVGVDKDGHLLLYQVDGIEKKKEGLTLHQMAVQFKALGAVNAINLDGGGSSATWYNGSVVDHPTCDDTGRWCVRAITTIVCVLP